VFRALRRAFGFVSDEDTSGGGETSSPDDDDAATRADIARLLDAYAAEGTRYNRRDAGDFARALARLAADLSGRDAAVIDPEYVRHLVRTTPSFMRHAALNLVAAPADGNDDDNDNDNAAAAVGPPSSSSSPSSTHVSAIDVDELVSASGLESGIDGDVAHDVVATGDVLGYALEHVAGALATSVASRSYEYSSFDEDGMYLSFFLVRYERRIFNALIERLLVEYSEERALRERTPYLWSERPLYVSATGEQLSVFGFRHIDRPGTTTPTPDAAIDADARTTAQSPVLADASCVDTPARPRAGDAPSSPVLEVE
jgi:hypothetical protein